MGVGRGVELKRKYQPGAGPADDKYQLIFDHDATVPGSAASGSAASAPPKRKRRWDN